MNYKNMLKTFSICLLISVLMFLPTLIKNKGLLTFDGDFLSQQIAFNINVNHELENGNNLYTFNNDLGSSVIEGYSFYNLGSVFFQLGLLFEETLYPYIITIFLIIKLALTGLFAYLYLEKFVNNKNLAILGSILYAFSGFQIHSIYFNHFIDSVMIFPLILYSLDRLIIENKKKMFIFTLSISILMNYVFAFGQIVFLLIYLIINFIYKRFNLNKENIKKIIVNFLLALLISLPILLPSVMSILNNPRIGNNINLDDYLIYPIEQYIKIFQSILLPTDTVFNSSVILGQNWKSCEQWLPLFGIVLTSIYIIKSKKDMIKTIIITLFIFMFIPFLNSSFTLFNGEYYARWFYIISLFTSIASIKLLDQEIDIKKNKLFKLIIEIYIFLIIYYVLYKIKSFDIFDNYYFISVFISILGILIIPFILKKYYKNKKIIVLIIPTIIFILIESYHYIYLTTNRDHNYYKINNTNNLINKEIIKDDEFFRVKYYNCSNLNLNLFSDLNSVDSFNSSIAPSSFKFYKSLKINRKQETDLSIFEQKLLDFLSVKYIISCSNNDLLLKNYQYLYKINNLKIYKNNSYKKMGIVYKKLPNISNKETRPEKIEELLNNIIDNNSIETKEIKNGISSKIYSKENGYILFTIPYDNNFKVILNDKNVKYKVKDNNFIVIKIKKGYNNIKIEYKDKYKIIGNNISLIALLLIILECIKEKKWKKKDLR